jgi:hypothetical protein
MHSTLIDTRCVLTQYLKLIREAVPFANGQFYN